MQGRHLGRAVANADPDRPGAARIAETADCLDAHPKSGDRLTAARHTATHLQYGTIIDLTDEQQGHVQVVLLNPFDVRRRTRQRLLQADKTSTKALAHVDGDKGAD